MAGIELQTLVYQRRRKLRKLATKMQGQKASRLPHVWGVLKLYTLVEDAPGAS